MLIVSVHANHVGKGAHSNDDSSHPSEETYSFIGKIAFTRQEAAI